MAPVAVGTLPAEGPADISAMSCVLPMVVGVACGFITAPCGVNISPEVLVAISPVSEAIGAPSVTGATSETAPKLSMPPEAGAKAPDKAPPKAPIPAERATF